MNDQPDQAWPAQYGRAQGLALLERLVAETGPIFTTEDAIGAGAALGLARPTVNGLLAQLAQGPWLARLKRGVYVVQSPLLSTEIHPFALAAALVQPCAISHWSALAFHGMTTQIPTILRDENRIRRIGPAKGGYWEVVA